jgi:SAM-dependent methyltransferase
MDAAEDLYGPRQALFYDAFHHTYAGDLTFHLKNAKRRPGPILELACGTGRVGIELIRNGADYFGIDAAEGMLELFRNKWAALGRQGSPPFQSGDMRTFELGRTFDTVLITHNSLQHIHRDSEVLQVFERCRRHLGPEGRLIFDVFNPDRRILERDPEKRHPLDRFFDEARGQWCEVSESNRYDSESKVNFIRWFYSYENGESGSIRLEMRQFFPQEMDALADSAGLKVLNKWGDFVGSGFSAASPRQVYECAAG